MLHVETYRTYAKRFLLGPPLDIKNLHCNLGRLLAKSAAYGLPVTCDIDLSFDGHVTKAVQPCFVTTIREKLQLFVR